MRIPVLLYHGMGPQPRPGLEHWTLTEPVFRQHLDRIVDSGLLLTTVSDLVARRAFPGIVLEPCVAITFDDGWSDFRRAAELMANRQVPCSLYVTTGNLGRPGCLDPEDLVVLQGAGVEIGAHGVTHRRLDELRPRDVWAEVDGAREVLRQLLQDDVRSFAYPHGSYTPLVQAAVIAAGYTSAVAVKHAFSRPDDDPFALARLLLRSDTTADDLSLLLAGTGAPDSWDGERLRTRGYRSWRRLRRRLPGADRLGALHA